MHYLVAVDLSEPTQRIVDTLLKCVHKDKDAVWLLHVAAPEPDFVGYGVDTPPIREVTAKNYHQEICDLERYEAQIKKAGMRVQSRIVQGVTAETILHKIEKWNIDMLIMGSHGKGFFKRVVLGSVSEEIVRRVEIPVVIVPVHEALEEPR